MITPLMHIFSCLNEQFTTDTPVDILYLSKSDRDLIISEANRLCDRVLDEDIIAVDGDRVFPSQQGGNDFFTLNPYTVVLLERLIKCARVYKKSGIGRKEIQEEDNDLSAQSTILRLEGNPDHIYYYVYKMMSSQALSYNAKISKLAELLYMLNTHSGDRLGAKVDNTAFLARIELQSHLNYWKTMLTADLMRLTKSMPEEPFTDKTVEVMREQLKDLGFYGFVNPLKMYRDFSSSRVTRKSDVVIPDKVLIFLGKVIQSGGGSVRIEDNN